MQQKKNVEQKQKKTGSFAQLMAQRDKDRLEVQNKQDDLERYEKPRGKEYMRLFAEIAELCDRLSELDAEIELMDWKLEKEAAEQEGEQLPASAMLEEEVTKTEIKVTWTEAREQTSQLSCIDETSKTSTVSWLEKTPQTSQIFWTQNVFNGVSALQRMKEKQERVQQLKQQREELVAQLQEAQRQFEAQLPTPKKLVGVVYPTVNQEILMKYGVIACPGMAYSSPKELLEQVKPKTQKEEEQWLKGDQAYKKYYSKNLLVVEVYLEVICVVYKTGEVKVLED